MEPFTYVRVLLGKTGVLREVFRRMSPEQVANILRTNGASDKTIATFVQNDILNGETIAGEITDEDLKDLGFVTLIQRKGIKNIIKLCIVDEGSICIEIFYRTF
jgi:hypothetical protein